MKYSIYNILLFNLFRKAQKELKDQISGLEDQLRIIEEEQGCPVDLESYINKLNSAKKRIIVVNNILQGAQVLACLDYSDLPRVRMLYQSK